MNHPTLDESYSGLPGGGAVSIFGLSQIGVLVSLLLLVNLCTPAQVQTGSRRRGADSDSSLERVRTAADSVAKSAYPEIKVGKLRYREFTSDTVFFKARFSIARYLTFRPMRYIIYSNPEAFRNGISDAALRGILAHELAHVRYYVDKDRFCLLGLAALVSDDFTSKFERRADLDAIARGFGSGLAEYRRWLFDRIDEKAARKKLVDYYSPREIEIISAALNGDPRLLNVMRRRVPKHEEDILALLRRCKEKADCGT